MGFSEFPSNDANIYLVVFLLDSLGDRYFNLYKSNKIMIKKGLHFNFVILV